MNRKPTVVTVHGAWPTDRAGSGRRIRRRRNLHLTWIHLDVRLRVCVRIRAGSSHDENALFAALQRPINVACIQEKAPKNLSGGACRPGTFLQNATA
jgi:hypothetical protein